MTKRACRAHSARHRHQQQNRPGTIYQASENRGLVGDPRALPNVAIRTEFNNKKLYIVC